MNDMLDAMDHDGSGDVDHIQKTFDPQDIPAMDMEQHREPDAERGPVQRLVESHAEGVDVAGVPVAIVLMRAMRCGPVRLLVQPVAHFGALGPGS